MYVPSAFAETDRGRIVQLIRDYPFGLLITTSAGLQVSHIPFVVDGTGETFVLYGHLAAANPQCAALDGGDALTVFQGPHAYVSPSWYRTGPAVPTWNYAAVHIGGRLRPISEAEQLRAMMRSLAAHDPGFDFDALPEGYRAGMIAGIRAFTLFPERVEGKWKMSQNRPEIDRAAVVEKLRASDDPLALATADLVAAAIHAAA